MLSYYIYFHQKERVAFMPKNKFAKNILAAALTLAIASALPAAVHAYSTKIGADLPNVLADGEQADIFYNFNNGTTNGFVYSGTTDGTVVSEYDDIRKSGVAHFDIGEAEGEDKTPSGIKVEYDQAPDIFYYRKLVYGFFVEPSEKTDIKYYTKAVFYSDTEKAEYSSEIHAGEWNTVCFDISDLAFRNKVKSMEILFVALDNDGKSVPVGVKVDDIGFAAKADQAKTDAFMNDTYSSVGAALTFNGADSITVSFESESKTAELSGNILVQNKNDKNAFRMIMENRSECKNILLYFANAEEDFTKEKCVSLPTAEKEGKSEYVFELKSGEHPSKIKLVFDGAESGEAEIYSFSMISLTQKRADIAGKINSVRISDDKKSLVIKGTVDYKTAVNYKNCKLALYRLNYTESEEAAFAFDAEPISVISMTSKFEFHIPISDAPSVFEKYAVRVYSDKDEIPFVPIDYAKYIENYDIYALSASIPTPVSPKGIQSENAAFVESSNAAHIVEDVYLDEMQNDKNSGYLHTANGKYYYFKKEYIDILDKKIKQYYASGCAVYLRILCRDGEGRLVSPMTLEDDLFTASAIDFLCSRYSENENGKIAGLILGEKTDLASKYNYTGELSLDRYVKKYVCFFRMVYNTAKQNNSKLKIYIPISDASTEERFSEEDLLGGMYDKNALLKSLCREIGFGGNAEWQLFFENEEVGSTLSNTAEISALASKYKAEYTSSPTSVMYFFKPSKETKSLCAEYAYLYYKLKFENKADAFVLSFSEMEKDGSFNGYGEALNLIKYTDTARSAEVSAPWLAYFNAGNWNELVSGYNEFSLEAVKLSEKPLAENLDGYTDIKGKIDLWDFSAAHSSLGWDAGSGCNLTKYSEDETGTFLYSEFSALYDGDFSSIIYTYETPTDYSKFPIVEFELAVNSGNAADENFEVCISFAGEKGIIESTGTVQNGKICSLFADLSDFSEKGNIRYIKIQVKGAGKSENLRIYRITGHSTEYDDAELLEAFEREASSSDVEKEQKPFNSMWIVIIATVVIISVAAFIRLTKNEKEKNEEK